MKEKKAEQPEKKIPPQMEKRVQNLYRRHLGFLLAISQISDPAQREVLFRNINSAQMKAVTRLIKYFLQCPYSCPQKELSKLQKHQDLISFLAEEGKKKPSFAQKKKVLLQNGGFLPFLLPLIGKVLLG